VLPSENLTISMDSWATDENWHKSCVDIASLHRTGRGKSNRYFQTLFSVCENAMWGRCLEEKINQIWIWPKHKGAYVKVQLNVKWEYVRGDALWPRNKRMCEPITWLERGKLRELKNWLGLRLCVSHSLPRALRDSSR
jgi:hypothetical protein